MLMVQTEVCRHYANLCKLLNDLNEEREGAHGADRGMSSLC